jgi:hypothetical protein
MGWALPENTRLGVLRAACPGVVERLGTADGIDAYFDNVGVLRLEAVVHDAVIPELERLRAVGDDAGRRGLLVAVSRIVWSDRVREWQLVEALWERHADLLLASTPTWTPTEAVRDARLRQAWVTDLPRTTDAWFLDVARTALEPGGAVLGVHSFRAQGSSADWIAAVDFGGLQSLLDDSRPGDKFEFWALGDLERRGMIVASEGSSQVVEDGVTGPSSWLHECARQYCTPEEQETVKEIAVLWRTVASEGDTGQCGFELCDLEGLDDGQLSGLVLNQPGQIVVLAWSDVDVMDEHGDSRGRLALVKVPNRNGEVPVGGPY